MQAREEYPNAPAEHAARQAGHDVEGVERNTNTNVGYSFHPPRRRESEPGSTRSRGGQIQIVDPCHRAGRIRGEAYTSRPDQLPAFQDPGAHTAAEPGERFSVTDQTGKSIRFLVMTARAQWKISAARQHADDGTGTKLIVTWNNDKGLEMQVAELQKKLEDQSTRLAALEDPPTLVGFGQKPPSDVAALQEAVKSQGDQMGTLQLNMINLNEMWISLSNASQTVNVDGKDSIAFDPEKMTTIFASIKSLALQNRIVASYPNLRWI